MSWSYRIARVGGIDVRVHATFLLLLAFYGYQGYLSGGPAAAGWAVLFISLLFLCVLLHEFGHAFAARTYGIRTPDITLLPIGGVARLERMPENPVQELVIAVAGPLVNVAIGFVLWLSLGLPTRFGDFVVYDDSVRGLGFDLLRVNGMLILFNLIPAFPMDGGRVLRALLAMRLDHAKATRIAARVGQGIAILFAVAGFGIPGVTSFNPFLIFIAFFVFVGAQQEAAMAGMRAAVAGMRVADAMITRFHTLLATMPVAAAAEESLHDTQPIYAVTDAHLRVLGMVTRNDLLVAAGSADSGVPVGRLANVLPVVAATASFDEAFRLMQESGSAVLPVVNPAGQILGVISLNLLRERAQMRR